MPQLNLSLPPTPCANPESSAKELKEDTIIVVLGASGDLAKKKTVCQRLPLQLHIYCIANPAIITVPSTLWPRKCRAPPSVSCCVTLCRTV
jgi:hypothetical protein